MIIHYSGLKHDSQYYYGSVHKAKAAVPAALQVRLAAYYWRNLWPAEAMFHAVSRELHSVTESCRLR